MKNKITELLVNSKNKVPVSKYKSLILLTLVLLTIDQVSKQIALNYFMKFSTSHIVNLLPFLDLTFVLNEGVSFSFLTGVSWIAILLISIFAFIFAFILITNIFYEYNIKLFFALSFMTAGSLGNIIDRVIYKGVIDFIYVNYGSFHFPVFNVADSLITLSACIIIVSSIKEDYKKTKR